MYHRKAVNALVLKLFQKNIFVFEDGVCVPIEFQSHFIGKPKEMWTVAAFILEVNFGLGKSLLSDLSTNSKENLTVENT